jgi:hypothetical protein
MGLKSVQGAECRVQVSPLFPSSGNSSSELIPYSALCVLHPALCTLHAVQVLV